MNLHLSQRRRSLLRFGVNTFCVLVSSGLGGALPAFAGETVVKTADEAKTALGRVKPGDTITLENGDYDLGKITLDCAGTETAPVVVRARQAGKARFIGKTSFVFRRAAFITLSGFDFATEDVPPIDMVGSHHIRLTENHFHVKEPKTDKVFRWVHITSARADDSGPATRSHHNRIDHCLFEEKHTIGNFLGVDGNTEPYPKAQISQYDRIDHNLFRSIGPRVPNGMEAIRVGLAGTSLSSGFTLVEDNLFENCDGDPEVISVKTSDAIIRNNTFRACQGGLCLRHGNRNQVTGNRFFGAGKSGSNGIRVYGDDHVIENNYLASLASYALMVSNGSADYGADYKKGEPLPVASPGDLLKLHLRPRRITLRKNVIVDCAEAIVLGTPFGLPLPQKAAQDIRFEHNTIFAAPGPDAKIVWIRNAPERLTWRGNVVYADKSADTGLPAGTLEDTVKVVRERTPGLPPVPPNPAKDIGPGWH